MSARVRRVHPRSALGSKCPDCGTPMVSGGRGGRRRSTVVTTAGGFACKECSARRRRKRTSGALPDPGPVVHPAAVQLGGSARWRAAVVVGGPDTGRRERHVGPRLYRTSAEALARAGRWARSWGRKSA